MTIFYTSFIFVPNFRQKSSRINHCVCNSIKVLKNTVSHVLRLACAILVSIQKGIFKFKNIIEINPSVCKYEIKRTNDINYGLITITDILPFLIVLCILLYTYSVFGILLYYLNIYSKRRWKRLTKKLKQIDNIVEMSLNVFERNINPETSEEDAHIDEKKTDRLKWIGKKGKKLKKKLKNGVDNEDIKDGDTDGVKETVNSENKTDMENEMTMHCTEKYPVREQVNHLSKSKTLPSMTFAHENSILNGVNETPSNDSFEKSTNKLDETQELTQSMESMSFLKTSSSLCEPLNLYKDEHSQSLKVMMKKHNVIVNVSEIDDRIVIQTISQNVQDNSNFNLETRGPNIELIDDIYPNINEIAEVKAHSKHAELIDEEIHLRREREEELNIQFILMLFFMTATFLLLWLPSEMYNYDQMMSDGNESRIRVYTSQVVYKFNAINFFNLLKSLNGVALFFYFYYMYNNFKIHFDAVLSQLFSSHRPKN